MRHQRRPNSCLQLLKVQCTRLPKSPPLRRNRLGLNQIPWCSGDCARATFSASALRCAKYALQNCDQVYPTYAGAQAGTAAGVLRLRTPRTRARRYDVCVHALMYPHAITETAPRLRGRPPKRPRSESRAAVTFLSDLVECIRNEAAQTHEHITQHAGQDVVRLLGEAGVIFQHRMVQMAGACDSLVAIMDQRFLLKERMPLGGSAAPSAVPSATPSAAPSRPPTPPQPTVAEAAKVEARDEPASSSAPSDAALQPPNTGPQMSQILGMLANPSIVAALRAAQASGMSPDAIVAMLQRASTPGGQPGG